MDEPRLTLTVKANLEVILALEPRSVNFGTVLWDEQTTRSFQLIGKEAATTKILGVEVTDPSRGKRPADPNLEKVSHVLRQERDDDHVEQWVDLLLGPQLKPGRFHGSILVRTDHPTNPELQTRLTGKVRGPVDYNPERLFFSNLEPGHELQRSVTVTGTESRPVDVKSVAVTHPSLTTRIERGEGGIVTVWVTSSGNLATDRENTTLILHTDHPDSPEIEIPVSLYKKRDRSSGGAAANLKTGPRQSNAPGKHGAWTGKKPPRIKPEPKK